MSVPSTKLQKDTFQTVGTIYQTTKDTFQNVGTIYQTNKCHVPKYWHHLPNYIVVY